MVGNGTFLSTMGESDMAGKVKRKQKKQEFIEITIINWDKYQPRKDIKNPTWFRLNNDFFSHPKICGLPDNVKLFYLKILTTYSQHNANIMRTSCEHLHYVTKTKHLRIKHLLRILKQNQLIDFKICTQRVRDPYMKWPLHNSTIHNNKEIHKEKKSAAGSSASGSIFIPSGFREKKEEKTKKKTAPKIKFDFATLYYKYPRHEGKSNGLRKCESQIKTQEDYDDLSFAIDKYKQHCKKTSIQDKFIKLFSTFMNEWKDWLDDDAGTVRDLKNEKPQWVVDEENKKRAARQQEILEARADYAKHYGTDAL